MLKIHLINKLLQINLKPIYIYIYDIILTKIWRTILLFIYLFLMRNCLDFGTIDLRHVVYHIFN
jgi:hypothetical protein